LQWISGFYGVGQPKPNLVLPIFWLQNAETVESVMMERT